MALFLFVVPLVEMSTAQPIAVVWRLAVGNATAFVHASPSRRSRFHVITEFLSALPLIGSCQAGELGSFGQRQTTLGDLADFAVRHGMPGVTLPTNSQGEISLSARSEIT